MALPSDYEYWKVGQDKVIVSNPADIVNISIEIAMLKVQRGDYVGSAGYQIILNGNVAAQGLIEYFQDIGRVTVPITGFMQGPNTINIKVGAIATIAHNRCGNTFDWCGQHFVNSCVWIESFLNKVPCVYENVITEIAWGGLDETDLAVGMECGTCNSNNILPLLASAGLGAGLLLLIQKIRKH